MPILPDTAVFQKKLAALALATYQAGETVITARSRIELKHQVQAGEPGTVIGKTVEKMESLLGASGASLVYAGYPYDPFAPDAPKS